MKKIYSIVALAGLFSLTAAAKAPMMSKALENVSQLKKSIAAKAEIPEGPVSKNAIAPKISTRAAATAEDVSGYYSWTAFDETFGAGGFIVNVDGTAATVENMFYYPVDLKTKKYQPLILSGTFDPAAGTITIPNQEIGLCQLTSQKTNAAGEVIGVDTLNYMLSSQNGEFVHVKDTVNAITGELDPVYQYRELSTPLVLSFENDSLKWPRMMLYVYKATRQTDGQVYYYGMQNQGCTSWKIPAKLDNTGWADAGTVQFTDGWLASGYGVPEAQQTWECQIQKSTTTEGLVRIVNPYGPQSPFGRINQSPCEGGILIDMGNAEIEEKEGEEKNNYIYNCVLALPDLNLPSGFYTEEDGMYTNYSYAGFMYWEELFGDEPYTYEELVDGLGSENIGYVEEVTEDEEGNPLAKPYTQMVIKDCEFGISVYLSTWAEFRWSGDVNTTATIVLPDGFDAGVNDVLTDDVNAPVRYYNLQGVEVAKPEAGQLVIMKKGGKTTKMIAR